MDVYSLSSIVALFLVSLLVVCICLDVIVKRRFLLKYAKKSAVLPYLPILGCIHLFLGQEVLPTIIGFWDKMKTPFFFWMFNVPYYFTNEPSEIKEILTNPNTLEKGNIYDFVKPLLLNSLLTAEVSIWKKKRRFLSRGFAQKKLEGFVSVFNTLIDKLIVTIDQKYSGNCLETIERFAAEGFMESLCILKIDEVTLGTTLYKDFAFDNIKNISKSIMKRYTKPWLYFDVFFFNSQEGREVQRVSRCLDRFLRDAIEEKWKIFNDNDENANKSLIDIMIKEDMGNDDIVAEIKLFLLASTETSGLTMAMALNLLAMHPDIQEKVLREILDVVGPDRPVEYNDITNLKFLEMVLQETLRLFPPAPIILRTVLADLHIGEILLPKGTNVAINIIGVHRSEKYWEDPLKFNPDRFLPEEVEKRPPGIFLPFSLGSRNCIGGKYAMMMMKTTLARLVRNYKITTVVRSIEDFKVDAHSTLVVKGIDCTFTERRQN